MIDIESKNMFDDEYKINGVDRTWKISYIEKMPWRIDITLLNEVGETIIVFSGGLTEKLFRKIK